MNAEIAAAVEAMASALGVAAAEVWGILLKQAALGGYTKLAFLIATTVVGAWVLRLTAKMHERHLYFRRGPMSETTGWIQQAGRYEVLHGLMVAASCVTILAIAILWWVEGQWAVSRILNPGYWAITRITQMLGG